MSEFLTVDELAEILHTRPSTIYEMRRLGRGPRGIRPFKRILFRHADVASWLEEHSDPPRLT